MELQKQNNKIKKELIKLNNLLIEKIKVMENKNAPRHEVRRIIDQQFNVETIIKNNFDFYNCDVNNEIEIACKIGDKY